MIPALASGPEFDRIRAIGKALGDRASGLGDDCALIPFEGAILAVSTDISVQNVHFRREWLSWEEIGWRAAAGALSDLAAVGAGTIGVLVSLAAPSDAPPEDSVALMQGVAAATDAVGGKVLGGDLSSSPIWTIDVMVIGRTAVPVRRSGARPGDGLWLTGRLGSARAALDDLGSGRVPSPAVRAAFAHPEPRLAAGSWLARHGAHAMIDLSDGLGGDSRHLAAASRVQLQIELDRLPLGPGVADAAGRRKENPPIFAARGGEDYELLAALPGEFGAPEQARFEREVGVSLTSIGAVLAGEGVELRLAGQAVPIPGFDHFR